MDWKTHGSPYKTNSSVGNMRVTHAGSEADDAVGGSAPRVPTVTRFAASSADHACDAISEAYEPRVEEAKSARGAAAPPPPTAPRLREERDAAMTQCETVMPSISVESERTALGVELGVRESDDVEVAECDASGERDGASVGEMTVVKEERSVGKGHTDVDVLYVTEEVA